jgi:hypothetical protein
LTTFDSKAEERLNQNVTWILLATFLVDGLLAGDALDQLRVVQFT